VDFLELALDCPADRACRAGVLAALVRAHWRDNPAGAVRHLTPLLAEAHDGHLGVADTLLLVRALAWHGRATEAGEVLELAGDPAGSVDPHLADDHRTTVAWLRMCDPAAAPGSDGAPDVAPDLNHAEQLLQRARVDHSALAGVWCALRTLIDADRLERATHWCTRLFADAQDRDAHTWRAVLSDVRAAIALRQGDLAVAADHARAALSALPAPGWGVAVGSPLSHLVLAGAATGDLAGAEETLRLTTPPAMRRSLFWVRYLRARGAYYEAADRPHAALADFAAVGTHLARWPADATAAVPWRVDLARLHVRLGRADEARALIADHLALPGDATPHGKGMALRVLAATRPPRQRLAILREATELLHASGDRHELAHAFADLSEAGHALGEFGRAKMMGRRALQLAKRCHAEPLRRRLHVAFDRPDQSEEPRSGGFAALSDAERRVVDLAARGHTNREIGHKLFVTVSTVEQHLTRAFRKLKVSRRTDLVPLGPLEEAAA
jgi:ATP/maltotriose-dependent transcriptional regulator MalT